MKKIEDKNKYCIRDNEGYFLNKSDNMLYIIENEAEINEDFAFSRMEAKLWLENLKHKRDLYYANIYKESNPLIILETAKKCVFKEETKYLTDEFKKELKELAKSMDVDLTELDSYRYEPANFSYDGGSMIGPSEDEYSESELFTRQIEKLINNIKIDGIYEYLDVEEEKMYDEEYINNLQKEAINYLISLER